MAEPYFCHELNNYGSVSMQRGKLNHTHNGSSALLSRAGVVALSGGDRGISDAMWGVK